MRFPRSFLTLVVLAGFAACGGTSVEPSVVEPAAPVATKTVILNGKRFIPPAIIVSPGDTVTWVNTDGITHNVTFDNTAIPMVANYSSGTQTTVMPTATGTYAYQCTRHSGMVGTVEVK